MTAIGHIVIVKRETCFVQNAELNIDKVFQSVQIVTLI